jgi:hypothetical protein
VSGTARIAEAEAPEFRVIRIKTEEEIIREELGEEFVRIARCESGLRQFDSEGNVLMSPTNDKGIFQINWVHWETAQKLGYDLDTFKGNLGYAKYLKERNGTDDWYMSSHCWLTP